MAYPTPGEETMGVRQRHVTGTQEVERHYSARHKMRVRAYLTAYPVLIPVLLEAVDYLFYLFGQNVKLTLEVVTDPEAPEEEQLFAYIEVPVEEADEAFEALAQFDEQWFLDQQTHVNGRLIFSLNFA